MTDPSTTSMRDAFLKRIYELAKKDRDVVIVSADFGAPALDSFRKDLASQFVNVGIAEHNMIAVASGLALEGKKPYAFAIAPFATSRCHEFTKVDLSLMKIPVKILGVGAGFSYDDSGPTHHTTEDISIMRALPNLEILCPADSIAAAKFADISYNSNKPMYIRLDRKVLPQIYNESENFEDGFKEIKKGDDICIISTGNMVHIALEVNKILEGEGKKIGVIDLYRLKPVSPDLKKVLSNYKTIISLEEHILDGGLGSIISEIITDNDIKVRLKRIGLTKYVYAYGGRENIQKICGIDADSVVNQISLLI